MDRHRCVRSGHRVGGTYIIVLGSALIISSMALLAITSQRLQRRRIESHANSQQAKLLATGAMRLAMQRIETDASWRSYYANPANLGVVTLPEGTMQLEIEDPYDSDLVDLNTDPVVLTGIGTANGTTQRVSTRLTFSRRPAPDCLNAGICTGGDIDSMSNVVIRSEEPVWTGTIDVPSSDVYGDVFAETLSNGTFPTTVVQAAERPALPAQDTAVAIYASVATTIDINSLPSTSANLIRNSDMESAASGALDFWVPNPVPPSSHTCDIVQSTAQIYSGSYSCLVTTRSGHDAGPAYHNEHWVAAGRTYTVKAWVYSLKTRDYELHWYVEGTGGGIWTTFATKKIYKDYWQEISGTITVPTWTGDLVMSYVTMGHKNGSADDFYVDDFSVVESDAGRYLDRQLLGPAHNPFGPANAYGIYLIDCGGQDLFINRSRIFATLIIRDPGTGSETRGSLNWGPAARGYPALMVDDPSTPANADFTLGHTRRALREADWAANFNPSGAPYLYASDGDQVDTYPSEITGMVYIGNDLLFKNAPVVRGPLLVGNDIRNSSGELRVYFEPRTALFPPPAFQSGLKTTRVRGLEAKSVLSGP